MKFVITRRESLDLADGINSFIYSLSSALVAKGHEVHLLSPTRSSDAVIEKNFGLIRVNAVRCLTEEPNPSHLEMVKAWRRTGLRFVRELAPDFVIVNGALPLRMPTKSCTVSHDLQPRWNYGSLVRRAYKAYAYRCSSRVVATCSELRNELAAEIHYSPERISIIPTCIDPEAFHSEPIERRETAVLHMGMPRYKQPLSTIRAFAEVKTPARLYLTGRPTAEVEDLIASLPEDVRARISLLGIVSAAELRRLLATVRVVSVPSLYHSPVASPTVLESFASKTPVVTTPCISQDVFQDGDGGYRADPGDTPKMAAAIDKLLADDELWTRQSIAAGRNAQRFTSARVAEEYISLAAAS